MSSSSSHPSAVPNSHTQNEILNHASGVTIYGGSFSNTGGDQYQYHHCTVQQTFVHAPQKKDLNIRMDLPELDQFTEVKRGDIYKDSSGVCYSWRLCSNGKDDTEAAVYHAELNIDGPFAQKKFTVKTYHGRNAMEEWRRDFLRCSADWCRDIPLFGYNMSSIPLLIFCGELIPVAHIQFDAGVPEELGMVYLNALRKTLHCSDDEIWMNPVKGKFCRGPAGPVFRGWPIFSLSTAPAEVEFLKEGVYVRYLASIKEDNALLDMLYWSYLSNLMKTFLNTILHDPWGISPGKLYLLRPNFKNSTKTRMMIPTHPIYYLMEIKTQMMIPTHLTYYLMEIKSPHSLNTVLIGKSLGTRQVMKPVQFPSVLALHSADQLSNSEQLLDVD
ncbi:hypothetical protein L218DRAFT_1067368 [Marasmius fiardii PR-910]|nr:hypothetical protein L218DRAFT_1067368 [Marasmius fiardii PR-910]